MRRIQHFEDGPDKILHIETEGCKVNIIIGTHDPSGERFTTVEILPATPDDDGRNWMTIGPSAVLVVPVAGTKSVAVGADTFSTDLCITAQQQGVRRHDGPSAS